MQQSSLLTLFMPIAIGIIMLGLGLSLTPNDFKRVFNYPKAAFIGLFCQMILLPFICFLIASSFGMPPALAVGLMLLSAAPGGATANLYSHLSDGDVALNITLTAVNSVLSLFTLPFIVNFALSHFMEAGQYVPMPFQKVIEVFAIVLIPVTIGMLIKAKSPSFALKMDKPVKIASALILFIVIVAAVIRERNNIPTFIQQAGLPVLVFNLVSMLSGYFIPLLFKVERRQAVSIGMEIGIHNATLAIFIALSVLNNSATSIPPAIYGILMFFTAGVFGYLVSRQKI